jgi:hypothetical protein
LGWEKTQWDFSGGVIPVGQRASALEANAQEKAEAGKAVSDDSLVQAASQYGYDVIKDPSTGVLSFKSQDSGKLYDRDLFALKMSKQPAGQDLGATEPVSYDQLMERIRVAGTEEPYPIGQVVV